MDYIERERRWREILDEFDSLNKSQTVNSCYAFGNYIYTNATSQGRLENARRLDQFEFILSDLSQIDSVSLNDFLDKEMSASDTILIRVIYQSLLHARTLRAAGFHLRYVVYAIESLVGHDASALNIVHSLMDRR